MGVRVGLQRCGDQRCTGGCDGHGAKLRPSTLPARGVDIGVPTDVTDIAGITEVLRAPGAPLDPGTRTAAETYFGHSFADVRVHTDARAAATAEAVGARAYTVGTHLVFGHELYAPRTASGARLLAHELTHVVQQSGTATVAATPELISRAGNPSEVEAERIAADLAVGLTGPCDCPGPVGRPFTSNDRDRTQSVTSGRDESSSNRANATVQRKEATGHAAPAGRQQSPPERELWRLAIFPSEALEKWKRLRPDDRNSILSKMTGHYGWDFAAKFRDYANAGGFDPRKTNRLDIFTKSTEVARDRKLLTDRGYKLAQSLVEGNEAWVNPFGQQYTLSWDPYTVSEAPGPQDEQERQGERCGGACTAKTHDRNACDKCCDDTIAAEEEECGITCHVNCTISFQNTPDVVTPDVITGESPQGAIEF